jgi:CHAD domain-containing protein
MTESKMGLRVRRFLPRELCRARQFLAKADDHPAAGPVHGARKSIKQLRAVLRLVRRAAEKHLLDGAAGPLRNAAHRLGPLRDHFVLAKITRSLRKRAEAEPEPPVVPDAVPLLRMARVHLRHADAGLRRLLENGWEDEGLPAGLRRLYKRGRGSMRQAKKTGSDGDLHAWRRRAKDLLYALDVIGASPRWRTKLRTLTEYLGDDHDLAGFARHYGPGANRDEPKTLLHRAKKRRARLQKKAFRLGRALFDERPASFAARILG